MDDGPWLFRIVPYKSLHNKCMATYQVHSGTPLKYLECFGIVGSRFAQIGKVFAVHDLKVPQYRMV